MLVDSAASGNPSPGAGGPSPAAPGPAGSPLDESQFALVQEAARAYKPIKRTAYIALGSAMTTLVIGTSAVAFTLFWPSFSGVMITVGVCAVGAVEFAGYRKMRQADLSAARWLGKNQLAFIGLIVLYCAIQMLTFSAEEIRAAAMSPEFRAQLGAMPDMEREIDRNIEQWAPLVTYGFYSLVIVLSVLFQGGLALYYFTRQKFLDAFQRGTPPWVRRLLIECGPDAAR
ncbi:MAG: hypothetical protein NTY65_02095 [Planctomycetota bacterium]|nr:hypothetical protein [Planctomycetota bacterium]